MMIFIFISFYIFTGMEVQEKTIFHCVSLLAVRIICFLLGFLWEKVLSYRGGQG